MFNKLEKIKTLFILCTTAIVILGTINVGVQHINSPPHFSRKLSTSDGLSAYDKEKAKHDIGCISRKYKLIYVHIPKTGGSTFEHSELFEDAMDLVNQGIRHAMGGHHAIWTMLSNKEERGISNFETATTVRHPCERFISAFRFVTSDKCSAGDRKAAKHSIGDMNIDEYVAYMEENEWHPRMLIHFYQQYPFVMDKNHDKVLIDTILCQEQWNEGIERLKKKIGITNVLPKLSHHEKLNGHETCADLKPETRSAIESFYAMDYCLFDYQSLPKKGSKCVGIDNNKESFSLKYKTCLKKLESTQSMTYEMRMFYNYQGELESRVKTHRHEIFPYEFHRNI